jgi:cytochrome c-type biogenesis protein CcmE
MEMETNNKLLKRRKIRIYIVFGILLVVLGILIYEGLSNSIEYFQTANQAVANRKMLGTSEFRIEGDVIGSTIKRKNSETLFSISSGKTIVPVINNGSPPQLFQPGIPVVLVGHFAEGNGPGGTSLLFISSQIMIKHTNQYIAAHPNRVKIVKT